MTSNPNYPCENCGKPVGETTQRGKHYQKRFCSIHCRNIGNAAKQERTAGKNCKGCGKYGYRKGDYCQDCLMKLPPNERPNGVRRWSKDDVAYLVKHYPHQGAKAVADHLEFDHVQVRNKANRLGLRLTNAAMDRIVYQPNSKYMTKHNPMKIPEVQEKVSKWWRTHPKKAARILEALFEGHQKLERDQPSALELRLAEILTDFGIIFEHAALIKPKFIVDFRIGNLIIQTDGDYWHGHPRFEPLTKRQKAQKRRDKAQDKYLTQCGYTVVRIWESELSKNLIESILSEHGLL
jgi:G:T-mismatch repair DNA endonuclease (very short patch repair protein)